MRVLLAVVATISYFGSASAGQFGCPSCQSCGGACVLQVEQVDDEETCYEVECKEICIPAVRFPWESCRIAKCGRTRIVSKLKEETRETKACEYKWVLVCDRCGRPAGEKLNGSQDVVPPAPKPANRNGNGKASFVTPPMPPVAPPTMPILSQPSNTLGGDETRPVISPRSTMNGYSVRSSTR